MIAADEVQNYETFRDCVSELLISKLSPSAEKPKRKRAVKGRKNEIKPVSRPAQEDSNDAADLSETIEVGSPPVERLSDRMLIGDSILPPRSLRICRARYGFSHTATCRTVCRWLRSTASP